MTVKMTKELGQIMDAQNDKLEVLNHKRGCFLSSFQAGADSSILEGAHLTGH